MLVMIQLFAMVSLAAQVLSQAKTKNEMVIKLSRRERYEIRTSHMLSYYYSLPELNTTRMYQNPGFPLNEQNKLLVDSIIVGKSFVVKPDLSKECLPIGNITAVSPDFSLPIMINTWNFTTPSRQHRHIQKSRNSLVISSLYRVPDPANATRNMARIETTRVTYNKTNFIDVKVLERTDIPGTEDYDCVTSLYIEEFDETISWCMLKASNTRYRVFLKRKYSSFIMEKSVMDKFKITWREPFTPRNDDYQAFFGSLMKSFKVTDGVYEIAIKPIGDIYMIFWVIERENNQHVDVSSLGIWSRITNFFYIGNSLLFVETSSEIRYVERSPGQKGSFTTMASFQRRGLIAGFEQDTEKEEIRIYSTTVLRWGSKKTSLNCRFYEYRYDMIRKSMTMTWSSSIARFFPKLQADFDSQSDSVAQDQFVCRRLRLVNLNSFVCQFRLNSVPPERQYLSYFAYGLPFTGGEVQARLIDDFPITFNSWLADTQHDLYLVEPLFDLFADGGKSYNCSLLMRRFDYPKVTIMPTLNKWTLPYLNLSIADSSGGSLDLNFEFYDYTPDDPAQFHIWEFRKGEITTLYPEIKRKLISLSNMAGGPFVVRRVPDINGAIGYAGLELPEVENHMKMALFEMDNFRVTEDEDFTDINFSNMMAFQVTVDAKPSRVILLAKQNLKDDVIKVYSLANKQMKKIANLVLSTFIQKAVPLGPNLFIFLMSDFSLVEFQASTLKMSQLNFQGNNCQSIELFYLRTMLSTLLCYTTAQEVKLLDFNRLMRRTMTDTVYSFQFEKGVTKPELTSIIFTSVLFESRIFFYSPTAKRGTANLRIFYLEAESGNSISLSKEIDLNMQIVQDGVAQLNQFFELFDLKLQWDILICAYRSHLNRFLFVFYRLNDLHELVLLKTNLIPRSIVINKNDLMLPFARELKSGLQMDQMWPNLVIKCSQIKSPNEQNLLLIDPFTPALSTVQTLILPRDAVVEQLTVFPFLTSNLANLRKESVGLLHIDKRLFREKVDFFSRRFYLFQLVHVDIAKVFIDNKLVKVNEYQDIFLKENETGSLNLTFYFESSLFMGRNDPNYQVGKNFTLMPRKEIASIPSGGMEVKNETLDTKYTEKKDGPKHWVIYSKQFSALNHPNVLTWESEPESQFDMMDDYLRINSPMNLKRTNVFDVKNLVAVDRYCLESTMNPIDIPPFEYYYYSVNFEHVCERRGWAFHFEETTALYDSDDISNFDAKRLIYVNRDQNCTRFFTLHKYLASFCYDINGGDLRLIDLETLEIIQRSGYPREDPQSVVIRRNTIGKTDFVLMGIKQQTASAGTSIKEWHFYNLYTYTYKSFWSDNFFTQCLATQVVIDNEGSPEAIIYPTLTDSVYSYLIHNSSFVVAYSKSSNGFNTIKSKTDLADNYKRELSFSISKEAEMKVAIFSVAHLMFLHPGPELSLMHNVTINKTAFLWGFQNYHSYVLVAFNRDINNQTMIFKLHNPFSEIVSDHRTNPLCHRWLCLIVSHFGNRAFIRVYDLPWSAILNNTNATIAQTIGSKATTAGGTTSYPLEAIPPENTFYPIEVKNYTDLVHMHIDTEYSNPHDTSEIRLLVFYSGDKMDEILVTNLLKVSLSNQYLSSSFIKLMVRKPYTRQTEVKLLLSKYREADYYKYWLYITVILGGTGLAAILAFKFYREMHYQVTEKFVYDPVQRMEEGSLELTASDLGEKQD